jgi:uncharacterized membrane protein
VKNSFQRYLLTGLAVILPVAASVWVVKVLVNLATDWLPTSLFPTEHPLVVRALGLAITLAFILFVGFLARQYLGKAALHWLEWIFTKLPLINRVYTTVKQVLDTVFKDSGSQFRSVVLVPFPHAGSHSIGFVANTVSPRVVAKLPASPGDEFVYVFVPTAPNPTSGFLMVAKKANLIPLPYTVETAFKLIISGGIIEP